MLAARKAHVLHVCPHDNARNARIYANPKRAAKTDARRTDGRTDGQVHVCVRVANVLRSKPSRSTARCIRYWIANRTGDICQAPGIGRSCKPDANERKLSALQVKLAGLQVKVYMRFRMCIGANERHAWVVNHVYAPAHIRDRKLSEILRARVSFYSKPVGLNPVLIARYTVKVQTGRVGSLPVKLPAKIQVHPVACQAPGIDRPRPGICYM